MHWYVRECVCIQQNYNGTSGSFNLRVSVKLGLQGLHAVLAVSLQLPGHSKETVASALHHCATEEGSFSLKALIRESVLLRVLRLYHCVYLILLHVFKELLNISARRHLFLSTVTVLSLKQSSQELGVFSIVLFLGEYLHSGLKHKILVQ